MRAMRSVPPLLFSLFRVGLVWFSTDSASFSAKSIQRIAIETRSPRSLGLAARSASSKHSAAQRRYCTTRSIGGTLPQRPQTREGEDGSKRRRSVPDPCGLTILASWPPGQEPSRDSPCFLPIGGLTPLRCRPLGAPLGHHPAGLSWLRGSDAKHRHCRGDRRGLGARETSPGAVVGLRELQIVAAAARALRG